jgi:tRNA (cytidine/uridine-2'-O-)-methyltransferase
MFNIVLLEPEKPDNTGNIGRTCVATGSALHLIYPIGFQLTRKNIHHAGLDYWERLKLFTHDSYSDFLEYYNGARHSLWFATTKAHKSYTDVNFRDGDFIMFGKESAGIPEEILASDEEHCIRIPMMENERSLNLSNSVAVVLYEALRQNNFNNLVTRGELHKLKYNN